MRNWTRSEPLRVSGLLAFLAAACAASVTGPSGGPIDVQRSRLATTAVMSCLIDASQEVVCWGAGGTRRVTPGNGTLRLVTIHGGGEHICGLTADSTAYCWGRNAFGEVGDGTRLSRDRPTRVVSNTKFALISASAYTTCALDGSGRAYCWGRKDFGGIGDGTDTEGAIEPAPKAVRTQVRFKAVNGESPNCGINFEGAIYCWGHVAGSFVDPFRAPGDCVSVFYEWYSGHQCLVPTPLATTLKFVEVAGDNCGITAAGAAYCWGDGYFGQFGDGRTGVYSVPPVAVSGGIQFGHLASGGSHVCGLDLAGKAFCWGNNFVGQLGIGEPNPAAGIGLKAEPTPVLTELRFVTIASRAARTCALTADGQVWCWGESSFIPVQVDLPPESPTRGD